MKSEERHRLQETELEKWGRHAHDFWDSFLKDYAKIAGIALALVLLIGGGILWWLNSSSANDAERWQEVLSASFANDPSKAIEDFAATAEKFPDHPAGQWAGLMEAERALSEGIRTSRTNRKASISELNQARAAFGKLSESKSELLQERRLFGLARCLETLAGVDVSGEKGGENVKGVADAVTAYEQFLERYPDSIYTSLAENRITALKTERAKDFYAWYREQAPNPADLKTPQDGGSPGSLPPGHPALPTGHPPIGSGPAFPTAPPVTEDSMMQELESVVKGTKGKADGEKAPDFPKINSPAKAEKPPATPPNNQQK